MSIFSDRLAQEIERLGGVSVVANKLGTVRNTLYNWINKENIPANKLIELSELGADVAYILTGQRSTQTQAYPLGEDPPTYGPGDPRKRAIVQMLDALDGEGLDHVQDAAEMAQQIKALKDTVRALEKRKAG